jgi:hypothetical protein
MLQGPIQVKGQYEYGGKYLKILPTLIGYQPGYISIEPQDVNLSKTYPLPSYLAKILCTYPPSPHTYFRPNMLLCGVLPLLNHLRQFQLTYTLLEPHVDKSHIKDPTFILTS